MSRYSFEKKITLLEKTKNMFRLLGLTLFSSKFRSYVLSLSVNYSKNSSKLKNLRFFDYTIFDLDLESITPKITADKLHEHSREEQLKLYLSGSNLASSLIGFYCLDQFIRKMLFMRKDIKPLAFEEWSFGNILKFMEKTPYGKVDGLMNDLRRARDIRNDLLIHVKSKKFFEESMKNYSVFDGPDATYEKIAFELLEICSRVESYFQYLFEKSLGPSKVMGQDGKLYYNTLILNSKKSFEEMLARQSSPQRIQKS